MEIIKTLVILLLISRLCRSYNYVLNGDFELPVVTSATCELVADGWGGTFFNLWNIFICAGLTNQCMDLQANSDENGYINQTILLPSDGYCNLSFYQKAYSTNYTWYVMEVYWNSQLIATQMGNTTQPTYQSFAVNGFAGNNTVMFKEIGNASNDGIGMIIDNVSLTCTPLPTPTPILNQTNQTSQINLTNQTNQINQTNQTNFTSQTSNQTYNQSGTNQTSVAITNQTENARAQTVSPFFSDVIYIVAVVLSLPANHFAGLQYLYLSAEDIWLYHYDKEEYQGIICVVFNTTTTIESLKFSVLDSVFHWQDFGGSLPISDYQPYAREEFIQIENSSSVLIKAVFPFFIYTIPQNILACAILYCMFFFIKKYKISQSLRKFYFIKTTLFQNLIEGNVIYFAYVCFGHLSTSFSFKLGDKASLLFTALFLWLVLIFTLVFYPLVGHFLQEKAGYFIYSNYRCNSGYLLLSLKNLARNFLRGAVFYFLHEFYVEQLALLSAIQILVMLIVIIWESTGEAFVSKVFYCLSLIYNFFFILLNFSLYFGYAAESIYLDEGLKELALLFQEIVIYLLISVTLILSLFDLLPLSWLKKSTFLQSLIKHGFKISKNKQKRRANKWKQKQRQELLPKLKCLTQENIFIKKSTIKISSDHQKLTEQQKIKQIKRQKYPTFLTFQSQNPFKSKPKPKLIDQNLRKTEKKLSRKKERQTEKLKEKPKQRQKISKQKKREASKSGAKIKTCRGNAKTIKFNEVTKLN